MKEEGKNLLVADENVLKYLGSVPCEVNCRVMQSVDDLNDCDLFLTHSEYHDDYIDKILKAKSAGVRTALIPDGIFEWRNSFEHPPRCGSGVGQEVWNGIVSDYFLAFGDYQKAIINAYSPQTKVEVIGVPRLEKMISDYAVRNFKKIQSEDINILIASAKTAGFCQYDSKAFVDCCLDLKKYFSRIPENLGVNANLMWRVSERVSVEIGLTDDEVNSGKGALLDVLEEADAVFSGPSTLLLEAMLMKKPVVLLDYTGSPVSVNCAWNIFSAEHIEAVVVDLLLMREERLKFQEMSLRNHICFSCDPSASLLHFIHTEPESRKAEASQCVDPNASLLIENNYLRNRLNRAEVTYEERLEHLSELVSLRDSEIKYKLPFGWRLTKPRSF